MSGGEGNPTGAPYRLNLQIATNSSNAIIDAQIRTCRKTKPSRIDVTYKLQNVADDKIVLTDKAIARVTVDRTAAALRPRARRARSRKPRRQGRGGTDPRPRRFVLPAPRLTGGSPVVALRAGEIDSFLARPDPRRPVVLIYGPDAGLVSERATALLSAAACNNSDPFAIVPLEGDAIASDPGLLQDEARTFGLFGGRRIVRVRAGSTQFRAGARSRFSTIRRTRSS